MERLQLVSGQLPQPDPGQHRPADLHRPRDRSRLPRGLSRAPRLQRAAREAPGARSRLGRVHGLSAVLAAVADRRGHGELRHRGRVPGRRAAGVRARRALPAGGPRSVAGGRRTTTCRRSSIGSSYAGNEAARSYLNGEIDARRGGGLADALRDDAGGGAPSSARGSSTRYRSYVINYNLGKDLVKQYVESQGGVAAPARAPLAGVRPPARVAPPAVGAARDGRGHALMDTAAGAPERRACARVRRDRHLPLRSAAAGPLRSPPTRARCRLRRRPQPAVLAQPRLRLLRHRSRRRPRSRASGALAARPAPHLPRRHFQRRRARSTCRGTTAAWTP